MLTFKIREDCRECICKPLVYSTISGRLVFFKQRTPIKIFKPKLVKILYHKNVNSSITYPYKTIETFIIKRTQNLEKQKNLLYGILLIVLGIVLQALSHTLGGSNVKDFFSGLLLRISIAEMPVGIYVVGKIMASR